MRKHLVQLLSCGMVFTGFLSANAAVGKISLGDSSPEALFAGAASSHYLLLSSGGVVSSWGDNTYGQCGSEPSDTLSEINYIDLDTKITKVVAGEGFSLALDENNIAYGWGDNEMFQLGVTTDPGAGAQFSRPQKIAENISDIAAGENFSLLLDIDGEVLFSGMGESDTLLPLELGNDAQIGLIAAGYGNIVAADENNNVYWLTAGTDDVTSAELPQGVIVDSIKVGREHIMLQCSDDENTYIYTWGSNSEYQLGIDGIEYSRSPVCALAISKSEYEFVNTFVGEYSVSVDAWNNMSDDDPITKYIWGTGCVGVESGKCLELEPVKQPEKYDCYYQTVALGDEKCVAFDFVLNNIMIFGAGDERVETIPLIECEDDVHTYFKHGYDDTEYRTYKVNFVKLHAETFDDDNSVIDESTGAYTDKYLLWEFVDEHHFRAKIKDFAVGTRKDVGIVRLSKAVTGENRSIACIGAEVWNFRVGNIMLTSDEQVIEYGHEDGTVIPIKVYKMSYRRQEEISLPSDTPVFYEEPGEITEETSLGLYIYGLPDGVEADVVWNESGDAEIRLSGNSSENIGGETRIKYSLIHIWNADEIQGKIGDYELENTMLNVASGSISGFKIYDVRYDIKSLRLLNENGGELSFVPNGGFIAEVCFNKAGDDGTKDTLIMAAYDPNGNLIYTDSVTAYFAEAYDHKFAFYVPAIYNNIDTIKVFVWDSFDSMIPMSDQEVKSNAEVS